MHSGRLFIILILICLSSLYAQDNPIIDSLEQQLTGAVGEAKLEILVELSKANWGNNPADGIKYSNEAFALATELDNKPLQAKALMYGGVNQWYMGSYDKAIEYYHKALRIAESDKDEKIVAFIYNNIGMVYFDIGEYKTASENYLHAANIMKKLNDQIEYAKIVDNIAKISVQTKDYEKALDEYLGIIEIIKKSGNKKFLLWVLSDIGTIYYDTKKYSKALDYYSQSLELGQEIDDDIGKAMVLNHLGNLFLERKEHSMALHYLREGLKFARKAGAKDKLREIYYNLSRYYSAKGDYKSSLENFKLFKTFSDSIFDINKIQKILEVQTKYEINAKEKENELLKLDNKVKQLDIDRQTTLRNFFIALTVLVLVMVILILNRLNIKKKANLILSEKNDLITQQKEKLNEILEKLQDANEKLQFQADKLAESNATKDKLFSIIAHDLKGPFTSILGYSDMLLNEYDDFSEKERKDIIADIDNAVNSTFKLLNNILTWSMSQLNAIEINKEKLQLSEIVNESIEPYLNKAELKEISVSNAVDDDVYINADKFTISTVIGNLTNNAIKFTGSGGRVEIASESSEDYMEIIISDTGVGMDKATMNNLLKHGKNYSTPGTNQEKGTGLGLIITNDFIKLNNGKIRIESELGKGSTFIVSLPHND